jgi:hypothetical protein
MRKNIIRIRVNLSNTAEEDWTRNVLLGDPEDLYKVFQHIPVTSCGFPKTGIRITPSSVPDIMKLAERGFIHADVVPDIALRIPGITEVWMSLRGGSDIGNCFIGEYGNLGTSAADETSTLPEMEDNFTDAENSMLKAVRNEIRTRRKDHLPNYDSFLQYKHDYDLYSSGFRSLLE